MSQDIFVVAEHLNGEIADVTYEMLGKAKSLASGGQVVCVLMGSNMQAAAGKLGAADKVIYAEHEQLTNFNPESYTAALSEIVGQHKPRLTLIANTSMGMDLAAALSAKQNMPLVAYAINVALENGTVVATSQLYGGKMNMESVLEGDAVIVGLLAGVFPAEAGKVDGAPQVETLTPNLGTGKVRFVELIEPEAGDVDITQQEILVSVGRGIQSEDNLEMMEALAKALGGAVSASRPIVDSKWLPKTRQVGKSGLKVKPKFYLALGISGAPEHIEGMKDADLIIAVNTDESAPIFEYAHYGTTEDLFDIVPALTERLRG
ncbi:MAG: electron transfer flavoprotein subunit alpha/FixB family protein [bacterium]